MVVMNITLESDGVHLQTDSSANKLIFKQGTNASLTFAENTGTATFLTTPNHPTPTTSANDTQSATTAYVRACVQSLVDGFNPDQPSSIGSAPTASPIVKASTLSFDSPLTATGSQLALNNIVFTAVYLTAGMQFNKYNIIAGITTKVPLIYGLFGPDWNYISNSETSVYNQSTTSVGGILTSTLTNTVTIETTGVHYIFYKSNAAVAVNSYYAGPNSSINIINCWRVSGTILSNGPFRSFYINGNINGTDTPSTFGNIGSKVITGWLAQVNFIFLTL